jgi:hypothetical protein
MLETTAWFFLSELGKEIIISRVKVLTKEKAKGTYFVTMTLDYGNYNITFQGEKKNKELQASSTPYKIAITNKGVVSDRMNIDFVVL